jgi:hypothetical protein
MFVPPLHAVSNAQQQTRIETDLIAFSRLACSLTRLNDRAF